MCALFICLTSSQGWHLCLLRFCPEHSANGHLCPTGHLWYQEYPYSCEKYSLLSGSFISSFWKLLTDGRKLLLAKSVYFASFLVGGNRVLNSKKVTIFGKLHIENMKSYKVGTSLAIEAHWWTQRGEVRW